MELVSIPEDLYGWELTKYIDDNRLNALMAGDTGQVHSERVYAYCLRLPRGYVTISAWYHPASDPYGEDPFELQFYFCITDGEILRELSLFHSDLEDQFQTVAEATSDLAEFFWRRMSMNVEGQLSLLGAESDDEDSELEDITINSDDEIPSSPEMTDLPAQSTDSTSSADESSTEGGVQKRIRKTLRTQTPHGRD